MDNLEIIPTTYNHFCKDCQKWRHHKWDCIHATRKDVVDEINRSRKHEKWVRKRAANYLRQLQLAHGKIAMLKLELNITKEKLKRSEIPSEPEFLSYQGDD